jgi:hypothetical protein
MENERMIEEERAAMVAEIQERYPNVAWPEARLEPIWYGRRTRKLAPDKMGIILNYKDSEYISYIATDSYKVVPYEEIVWRAEKAMEQLEEFGKPSVKIDILQEGKKFIYKATFNECPPTVIREGHEIQPNISFRSSHDGMWELSTLAGAAVLVCSNGLIIGKTAYNNKQKHLTGLSIKEIVANVKQGMIAYSEETGVWKQWAERQLEEPEFVDLTEKLPFGERYLEGVMNTVMDGVGVSLNKMLTEGKRPTVWDTYMAATQFLRDVDSPMVQIIKTEQVTNVLHSMF